MATKKTVAKKATRTRNRGRWKEFIGKGVVTVTTKQGKSTAYEVDGKRRILYKDTDTLMVLTPIGEVKVEHEGTMYNLDQLMENFSEAIRITETAKSTNKILEDLPWEPAPTPATTFSMNQDGRITVHGGPLGPIMMQYKVGDQVEVPPNGWVSIHNDPPLGQTHTFKVDAVGHAKEEDLRDNNVMTQALAIIYGDREKTYGHPSLNLESIAQLWTVYMKRKAYVELTRSPFADDSDLKQVELIVPKITIDDVCQMMVLLKMARLINDPTHHDSMVDQVGYIGLQERVQL